MLCIKYSTYLIFKDNKITLIHHVDCHPNTIQEAVMVAFSPQQHIIILCLTYLQCVSSSFHNQNIVTFKLSMVLLVDKSITINNQEYLELFVVLYTRQTTKSFDEIRYMLVLNLVGHICIWRDNDFQLRRTIVLLCEVALEILEVNIIYIYQIEVEGTNT